MGPLPSWSVLVISVNDVALLEYASSLVEDTVCIIEPTGNCFKGAIADVRVYSRDLNATEIALVKSQIVPNDAPTADLIGHWKLDETSGTTAVDSSTSGNNGTHTNSPTKFGNKATAVADLYHWETVLQTHSDASKILNLPSCTMKSFRDYFSTDSVVAKGDMTFTTELQIDAARAGADQSAENQFRMAEFQTAADFLSKNAGFKQQMDLANLSNDQQMRLANLSAMNQADAESLSNEQQTDLANLNKQMQVNIRNKELAQQMNVAQLNTDQQMAIQNASIQANLYLTKFNTQQQV